MTSARMGSVFAAALLLVIGNASAETAGLMVGSPEKSAGELPARVYFTQHRADFASLEPSITAGQVHAALVEGRRERLASDPQSRRDGGEWSLPTKVMIELEDIE